MQNLDLDFDFIPPERLPTELVPYNVISKRIELVHDCLVKGISKSEITDIILNEKYLDIHTKREAYKLIKSVYDDALFKEQQDTIYSFNLHLVRYEDLYSYQMKMENKAGLPLSEVHDLDSIAWKLQEALNVLKQKEELLGLHDKALIVEINNIHLKTKRDLNSLFSFDSLEDVEKLELLGFLRKIRINANDGVQPFSIIGEHVFEDEEHIENIMIGEDDSFETPINDVEEVSQIEEEDNGKTISEVKKDIALTNLEKFKLMMKAKGGKV